MSFDQRLGRYLIPDHFRDQVGNGDGDFRFAQGPSLPLSRRIPEKFRRALLRQSEFIDRNSELCRCHFHFPFPFLQPNRQTGEANRKRKSVNAIGKPLEQIELVFFVSEKTGIARQLRARRPQRLSGSARQQIGSRTRRPRQIGLSRQTANRHVTPPQPF
jgi:hypothetical protein